MLPYESFQAALRQLYAHRDQPLAAFTELVGRNIFEGLTQCLEDSQSDHAILRVLPAPTGSGKTSCAIAFAAAWVREGGTVLILSSLVENCETIWKELAALIGNQAAYWSSQMAFPDDHDGPGAMLGSVSEAKNYPALVITQQKFSSPDRADALYVHGGKRRELIIVDERPEHTHVPQITLTDAEILHGLAKQRIGLDHEGEEGLLVNRLGELCKILADEVGAIRHGSLEELSLSNDVVSYLGEALKNTKIKNRLSAGNDEWDRIKALQGFCEAAASHCAFVASRPEFTRDATFVGYRLDWPVIPGMAIMDATGEIDGLNKLYNKQTVLPTPQADYRHLSVTQIEAPEGTKPSGFQAQVGSPGGRKSLLKWLSKQVSELTTVEDRVLIVSFKALINSDEYRKTNWGDRQVAQTWFGQGIGSNEWRDCNVVFIIGEFWMPRRVHVGQANALKEIPVTGTLKEAVGGNSLRGDYGTLSVGHHLRQLKQMAMRGTGRKLDENGIAAPMHLFLCGHSSLVMAYQSIVFPNAKPMVFLNGKHDTSLVGSKARRDVTESLMKMLVMSDQSFVSSDDIQETLGTRLAKHKPKLDQDPVFQAFLITHGWVPISGSGRGSKSGFEKQSVPVD
jgi:hypothetical protein